ncbi:MAG TPA: hypothetical protein VKS24_05725 [Bradyrhizobium sp.]|nr:hypothetical protein [Bradyrhizobium sp.]
MIGISGDFAWAGVNGTANDPFFNGKNGAPIPLNTNTDRIASVTGRVGGARRLRSELRLEEEIAIGPANVRRWTD